MYLFIDTTGEGQIIAVLLDETKKIFREEKFEDKKAGANNFLVLIDKLFLAGKITAKKIKGIIVATGPGAFSRLRTGVSVGNGLSFALNIPIAGIHWQEVKTKKELIKKGIKIIKRGGEHIIEPFYGKEPNITVKK